MGERYKKPGMPYPDEPGATRQHKQRGGLPITPPDTRSEEELADGLATLENSTMLCCGQDNAIREAYMGQPLCFVCNRPKKPVGCSCMDNGLCDSGCSGYLDAPRPLNLHFGEQLEIRRLIAELLRRAGE